MFYLIGRALDKTFVNFDEKDRFAELKKQYKKTLSKVGLTFVLLVFIIICGFFVWYKGLNPAPASFFLIIPEESSSTEKTLATPSQAQPTQNQATASPTPSSQSKKLVKELDTSLSPRMSPPRVQSWLKHSLIEMHSMNFINYENVLNQTRVIFRDDTYQSYLLQMNKKEGLVSEIKDKSLVMSLTPLTEVRIIDRGSTGKYRVWKMQMVGLLVRTGSIKGGVIREKRRFDVLVEEVPTTKNPYGLVISQYATEATTN